jgi:hypothetical protein
MKISNKLLDIRIFLLLSFILILLTNSYFSLEESIIYGARDGADYFILADNFQKIPNETLPYHKAWRFIVPTLIGIISEILNLETYLVFRIATIIACLSLITLFFLILKKLKIDDFHIFFLTLILIFNPYLFRYFLAAPTMINDLVFINSGLLIILGIIDKKKIFFYFGFLIALATRQNSIFFLLTFVITKLIFKKNSLVKFKDILFTAILTLLIFIINSKFAAHYTVYNESYSLIMRLHLFTFDFTFLDFVKYNLFPLIILLPPVFYLTSEKKKFDFYKIKIELFLILLLMVLFTVSVAYVGGPIVTGKNLIRLINLTYPLMILFMILPFNLKKNELSSLKSLFYMIVLLIWSLHPTFSNIKILSFLKF